MKVRLKIRYRGKRGYDIRSVPFKKLEKASKYKKKAVGTERRSME